MTACKQVHAGCMLCFIDISRISMQVLYGMHAILVYLMSTAEQAQCSVCPPSSRSDMLQYNTQILVH